MTAISPVTSKTSLGAAPASAVTTYPDPRDPDPLAQATLVLRNRENFDKFDVAKDRSEGNNSSKGDGKVGKEDLRAVRDEGVNGPHHYSQDMVNAANTLLDGDGALFDHMSYRQYPWSDPAISWDSMQLQGYQA